MHCEIPLPDADGYNLVIMEYSAKNALGAGVKATARGKVNPNRRDYGRCDTKLLDPGF